MVCSNIISHVDECKCLSVSSEKKNRKKKENTYEIQLTTVICDWGKTYDQGGQVCILIPDL